MAKAAAEKKEKKKPPEHPPEEKAQFGARLKAARLAMDIPHTQDDVAHALGLGGKQAISQWESGKNLPDPLRLRQLSKVYRVSMDELAGAPAVSDWPFSLELHKELTQRLREHPEERRLAEASLWVGYLRKEVPQQLHYRGEHKENESSLPKPQTVNSVHGAEPSGLGKVRKHR